MEFDGLKTMFKIKDLGRFSVIKFYKNLISVEISLM